MLRERLDFDSIAPLVEVRMIFFVHRAVLGGGLIVAAVLSAAQAAPSAPAPAKPAAAAPAPAADDPSVVSGEFWGDWNKTKASPEFAALKAAVGGDAPPAAPQAGPQTQRIVDIAIAKPQEAAKVLSAAATTNDAASANALSTVVAMTTSPEMREEAAALVAPEAQAQVESFRANLSTGIPGLPGIYLGDNASANGGERAVAPAGYTPVAGGSSGCPGR